MNRAVAVILICAGCASTPPARQPEAASPPASDTAAATKAAQDLAEKLKRAQARAAESVKGCPPADAPMSDDERAWLGEALAADLGAAWIPATNPRHVFVDALGRRLAKQSARPDAAWSFAVFENDRAETASFPPARVAISTGALRAVENEAQLAGLLGHEIGHVLGGFSEKTYASVRHNVCVPAVTVEAYEAEGMADLLPAAVRASAPKGDEFRGPPKRDGQLFGQLAQGVVKLRRQLGEGAAAELEADRVAFELLVKEGYETRELDKAIDRVGLVPNHPPADERKQAIAALREKANPPKGKSPPLPKGLK